MRIDIDRARCIGSENCVRLAPRTFDLDVDGIAVVHDASGHRADEVVYAARACPVAAILVGELDTTEDEKEPR